ncbi:MAG: acetyl-CoA hydrolase/transferase C-terminal domain-containing protein [Candidatus Marinimicrobia bacterium]|nr:acetyl-CoA hydrolase/transferase C-terminal domain-containing protein [Candidatus Neomarinimicrobiota bacterium]MDD5582943.1 acetyl-CoA hydrolase/transferase C-terminal domain-containing protein [Candidatus Neomarinimicrobiota bacterium]
MTWKTRYDAKVTPVEEAVKAVKSGDTVYVHSNCAVPEYLIDALVSRASELKDVTMVHILTLGKAAYTKPEMEGHFRTLSLFSGSNVRQAIQEGRGDFVPIFLHEVSDLFWSGHIKINVALIQVSPPDDHGYCSFGVSLDHTRAATETADIIIAQVNPKMPRVHGNTFIHVDDLDFIVEAETEIFEFPKPAGSEEFSKIGQYIADLIEDGATMQTGIGGIPDAVLNHLYDKKNLGIHSEMFSDGVIELVKNGVINNSQKKLHRGKITAGFVLGSRRLFDFIDDNPLVEFHNQEYINNPWVIAQNPKMVAINSALEVDITGQICADSIGIMNFSGIGGQVDFFRGAKMSPGGKAILALTSTAKCGTISRIVPFLKKGASVTTTRADVHYIVTEYGVAYVHGKSLRERAKALINIAHPTFREDLEKAAWEWNLKV